MLESPHTQPDREGRRHTGGPDPPARPTFEQLHDVQLEGDAVLLGEDVDSAAGLGQQVQVELQTHEGGSRPKWGRGWTRDRSRNRKGR